MNEAETRAEHIDPALKAAGWGMVDAAAFCASIPSRWAASKDMGGGARLFPLIMYWFFATVSLQSLRPRRGMKS